MCSCFPPIETVISLGSWIRTSQQFPGTRARRSFHTGKRPRSSVLATEKMQAASASKSLSRGDARRTVRPRLLIDVLVELGEHLKLRWACFNGRDTRFAEKMLNGP